MKIVLFNTDKHSDVFELTTTAEEIGIEDTEDYSVTGDIRLNLKVFREGNLAILNGEIEADIKMECARCLEQFINELRSNFELVVRQLKKGEVPPDDSEDDEEDENDTDILFIGNDTNEIELNGYIHDMLLLEIPYKPVCSEDCKGLCTTCGANLNTEQCNCKQDTTDNRWSALSEMFDSDDS